MLMTTTDTAKSLSRGFFEEEASDYGVGQSSINSINLGKSWRHLYVKHHYDHG